ncbi:toxin-antitoxin system YwqK family antitoxin [Hymenobacter glacieicola]|uniref:MORN repeat variant n=1 Tax=Hymenobacter glacieicola TaxID=1562124 RepID=A0ABQ1WPI5_9BACT|nr:hypothetical protein [Hymenobacter glacieicola]GGG40372.1 hypothetical protein GCM10011378_15790 [Hymenobacter glacieicola]
MRHGPVGFWSRNRYDGGDQRHGPWREYFDQEEKQLANRGRYRHGLPVGVWRNYNPGGQLEHTERFYRHPYGLVTLAYYHPNGKLAKRGRARYRAEPTGAHFFWFGEWQRFGPDGQPLPSEWYQDGTQTAPPASQPHPGTTIKLP